MSAISELIGSLILWGLRATVLQFLVNNFWRLLVDFKLSFPHVVQAIECPMKSPFDDKFIWTPPRVGVIICKDYYNFLSCVLAVMGWSKFIWARFIPLSNSVLCWKLFHNILSTYDRLQRSQFILSSCCSLCGSAGESSVHMFLQCAFLVQIWNSIVAAFRVPLFLHTIFCSLYAGQVESPTLKQGDGCFWSVYALWGQCIVFIASIKLQVSLMFSKDNAVMDMVSKMALQIDTEAWMPNLYNGSIYAYVNDIWEILFFVLFDFCLLVLQIVAFFFLSLFVTFFLDFLI